MKMKKYLFLLTIWGMCACSLSLKAQVTYMETNNFLLNFFTGTGYMYTSYDWHFEPYRTDFERGNIKGAPTKIVTNILDKSGRGFGEHFTDTTYYNSKGNITKIIALKRDEFNPNNIFRPDKWVYDYDGVTRCRKWSEIESATGKYMKKEEYTLKFERQTTKELCLTEIKEYGGTYKIEGDGDVVLVIFHKDENGNLKTADICSGGAKLIYSNGRVTEMLGTDSDKPIFQISYDASGHLTSYKSYGIDGMDDVYYTEALNDFTYNEKGDISKVVKTSWDCNSKWVRHKVNYVETYTLTYIYDAKGNWASATVFLKAGSEPRRKIISITREITY